MPGLSSRFVVRNIISSYEWEQKMRNVKINREDMDKVVMNLLTTEGYLEAAEIFHAESGTQVEGDILSMNAQVDILDAILSGNIEDAIEKVKDVNPLILDSNPDLFFYLQQQRFINLIVLGSNEAALKFAQEVLGPHCEKNPYFLEELGQTMALLAYQDPYDCPFDELMSKHHRQMAAREVNAAILISQNREKEPRLSRMLKQLIWFQNQLNQVILFPRIHNLNLIGAILEDPENLGNMNSLNQR